MLYALIIIIALITAVLLLNLRVRLQLDKTRRSLFLGLGRSGSEIDLITKTADLKLFNFKLKTFSLERDKTEKTDKEKIQKKVKPKKGSKRKRPISRLIKHLPKISSAFLKYSISVFKAITVEELNGDIKAGFDSPDLTGLAFGYYQATTGAIPTLAGRLNYEPVWDEASFDASIRASVAIPMYKLIGRTIIFIFALPLRELLKFTIGYKERSHDGK